MNILRLMLISFATWLFCTLTSSGNNLLLMPLIDSFLDAQAVPPVATVGMLLNNSQRTFIFWKNIDLQVIKWYLPGAILGFLFSNYISTHINIQELQILLGLILVATASSYRYSKQVKCFTIHAWYFLPGVFLSSSVYGLVGISHPFLNTLYLNYGFNKEQIVANKAVNALTVNAIKLMSYAACGTLTQQHTLYGLAIGVTVFPAQWLGQFALRKLDKEWFRQLINGLSIFNKILALWKQQNFLIVLVNHMFFHL